MNTPLGRTFSVTLPLCLASLALGCSRGPAQPANLPPLTPCTLQVQFKQTPVEDATVTLIPVHGDWVGVGRTDSAGKTTVQTQGRYAGVPAGEYIVTVTKWDLASEAAPDPTSPEADAAAFQNGVRPVKRKSLVPDKYTKQETSDLQLTVTDQAIEQTLQLSE